jgi:hypothetical protein
MAVYAGQTLAGIIMTKERFYENAAVRTTREPASRINREKNEFNDWKTKEETRKVKFWVLWILNFYEMCFCKVFVFSGSASTASGVIVDAQERV